MRWSFKCGKSPPTICSSLCFPRVLCRLQRSLSLFVIITRLNLLDNLFTLIIVYTAMNLPLIVWMSRSYFMDLPKEVLEGAWLDGSTTLQTILRIVVPMAAPGLAAAALLSIIFAWNDFFFAVTLTYTNSPTLPIMVATFTSNEGLFLA